MRTLNKKAQGIQMIMTAVIVLFILGFVLIMGLLFMDELLLETADSSTSTNNETLTVQGDTSTANKSFCGFNNFAITECVNYSGAVESIDAGNYTVNARAGTIKFEGDATNDEPRYNHTDGWNCTFTFDYSNTEVCEATNATIEGQGKFGDYIDLIALAVIISIIIGLLLVAFAVRGVK